MRASGKAFFDAMNTELGYVCKEQGLFDAALASYRRWLELRPDSDAVRDGIRLAERQM